MKPAITYIPILLIIWGAVFFPVYPDLFRTWLAASNADNSYGILVPFISLYFIWGEKGRLEQAEYQASRLGLVILVSSLSMYLLSYAGGVVVLQRMMIVLSLNGLVLYLFGKDVYKLLAFPLLFLFFMVPIPESVVTMVSFPLQTYATIISSTIIQWSGIPVYREGHMLYFTQTQLEVAEACSGIRSVSALLMLSVIFMHQCENSRIRKAVLVLSSIVIAFVANILRVSGTGFLAHFFGARVARGFLHEFSGVIVFAFGFLMLLALYRLLNCKWFGG